MDMTKLVGKTIGVRLSAEQAEDLAKLRKKLGGLDAGAVVKIALARLKEQEGV